MSNDNSQQSNENVVAIRFENLTRKFGDFVAVDSIDLDVPHGSFYGFLGPNGAGKSTTINMLIGLLKPTSGKIYVYGADIARRPIAVKKIFGIVPEHLNLYERLKGREFLEFSGVLYGLTKREALERAEEVLDLLEVDGEKHIVDLSQGMKKKVSLGAAVLHKPKILVLDEPFISVDAISARKIKDILISMVRSGVTIFMTSHTLEIIERLCTEVAIINHGKILLVGSTEEICSDPLNHCKKTLEDVFVKAVGGDIERGELSWLK